MKDVKPSYRFTEEYFQYTIDKGSRKDDVVYDIDVVIKTKRIEGSDVEIEFSIFNDCEGITLTDKSKVIELFTVLKKIMEEPIL